MIKFDELEKAFKDLKEELSKNMNGSYAPGANMVPTAATGTSGGQGGMYRSEMDKNCAPPATMNLSEDGSCGMEKQMVSASPGGSQDMMVVKFDKNGQWRMEKSAFKKLQHKIENQGHSKESAAAITASIGRKELGQKEMTARSKAGMHKNEDGNYLSTDGKNREANPKLRQSDIGPGGKIHMVKEEGTNEEANPTQPHNKNKFKVMPMTPEKSEKRAETSGKPYNGKDKDVKKGETCKGHIQGNEAKGNDENKAPGRGQLGV